MRLDVIFRMWSELPVKNPVFAFAVEKQNIVDDAKAVRVAVRVNPLPNDFVKKPVSSKDFVHRDLHVMPDVPVEMDVD